MNTLFVRAALLVLTAAPLSLAHATGLQGVGGGTPGGPTVFTFTPNTGPINSGATAGVPSAVTTTDGGSVFFTAPVFSTGGNFVVTDASHGTLLQGDFVNLQQYLLSSTSLFASLAVTYTGGSDLLAAGFAPGDTGTLGLTLSGVQPGAGTGPQTASEYGLSFDVSAVPEPSTVAPFLVAGVGLLLLTARARRRRDGA